MQWRGGSGRLSFCRSRVLVRDAHGRALSTCAMRMRGRDSVVLSDRRQDTGRRAGRRPLRCAGRLACSRAESPWRACGYARRVHAITCLMSPPSASRYWAIQGENGIERAACVRSGCPIVVGDDRDRRLRTAGRWQPAADTFRIVRRSRGRPSSTARQLLKYLRWRVYGRLLTPPWRAARTKQAHQRLMRCTMRA